MGLAPSASSPRRRPAAARLLVNAMIDPSGDHSGNASKAFVSVRRSGSFLVVHDPDVLEAVFGVRRERDLRAIGRPGRPRLLHVGVNVSRVTLVPSASIVKMSQLPSLAASHRAYAMACTCGVPVGHGLVPVRGVGESRGARSPGRTPPRCRPAPCPDLPKAMSPLPPGNAGVRRPSPEPRRARGTRPRRSRTDHTSSHAIDATPIPPRIASGFRPRSSGLPR